MSYDPKLAAGNPQIIQRGFIGRSQAEAIKNRVNRDKANTNIHQLQNQVNNYWSEQDEKAKR
ncbi:hypothetical protein [Hafnia paralvei]|uniref:hypothetical protein n=1 Tax=Hafnia paralvei TaxID=546367 RepID=UPI000BB584ED|nr:hypothetical protein [Hafnia paralvei]PNK67809.1 hypothetical protein A6J69_012515 [Hafnia paralvei]